MKELSTPQSELLAHTVGGIINAQDGHENIDEIRRILLSTTPGAFDDVAWRRNMDLRVASRALTAHILKSLDAAGFSITAPADKVALKALKVIQTNPAHIAYELDEIKPA